VTVVETAHGDEELAGAADPDGRTIRTDAAGVGDAEEGSSGVEDADAEEGSSGVEGADPVSPVGEGVTRTADPGTADPGAGWAESTPAEQPMSATQAASANPRPRATIRIRCTCPSCVTAAAHSRCEHSEDRKRGLAVTSAFRYLPSIIAFVADHGKEPLVETSRAGRTTLPRSTRLSCCSG
jgi:hypothetical protein